MAKYYAVRVGYVPGIYLNWSDCEKQVKGFSGAKYKSFSSKIEAENFMGDVIVTNEKKLIVVNIKKKVDAEYILIYTDGSHFKHTSNYLGYGGYCIYDGIEYEMSGHCTDVPSECSNPTAEFMGFCEVLRMFVTSKKYKVKRTDRVLKFHIDYEGVEKWMSGEWQTKKEYIKDIKDECTKMLDYIPYNVIIEHVSGHATPEMKRKNPHLSHIYEGNDNADRLAKSKETINTFADLVKLLSLN